MTPYGDCGPATNCTTRSCGTSNFLRRLYVTPRITGGTEIFWSLNPSVRLASPEFRVEYSAAGHNRADDWQPITRFAADVVSATDPDHRSAGWYQKTHYRVTAKDSSGNIFHSEPTQAVFANLPPGQARMRREIIRREQARYQLRNTPATRGYLLKVRYYGDPCSECTDPDTGEPTDDQCDVCYGVGYELGYHAPYPCFYADLGDMDHDLTMFKEQGAFVSGGVRSLRYLNLPPVDPWDVWVNADSDHRYLIGKISPQVSFGDLDILCRCAASRLSFDHPVYRIDMPSA